MSRLYDNVIPVVISDEVLLAAVEDQQERDGVIEVAQEEDVDFSSVNLLNLNFKNILKIEHLWCFKSLTKLHLDNNIIEKIEGLETLVNLVWLDLSFNNIEKIEGLERLSRLQDLSLYNNRIQIIEGLDSLTQLHVLSLGNNDISELKNMLCLRRLKNLRTLNMSGNPVCLLEDYKPYSLAHLPLLEYLDYRRVKKDERHSASEKYEISLQELIAEESLEETKLRSRAAVEQEQCSQKESFVASLKGSSLFDSMYAEDAEGQKLSRIPPIQEMVNEFKEKFVALCQQLFTAGLEKQAERQAEVDDFQKSIEKAKLDSAIEAASKIQAFSLYKDKVWQDLSETIDQSNIDIAVTEYHQKVGDLWDVLMNMEMQLADQIEDTAGYFERSVAELVDVFLECARAHMAELRDLENKHYESLQEMSAAALDMANRNELNEDVMEELQDILVDKDSILSAVATSHDTHVLKIDGCEDDLIQGIQSWQSRLIQSITEQHVVQRNRQRVIEINHVIDHLRDEIDNIDFTVPA